MKKVLGLLTIAITVFAFATVVMAAGNYNRTTEPAAHAYLCGEKCPLGTIPCPKTTPGVQGAETTEATGPFDYDGKPYKVGEFGTTGYNYSYNYNPASDTPRNCKFVFDVCSCGAACAIEPGAKMGIQMTIKTQGVYWADSDVIPATETDNYGTEAATPRAGSPTVFFDMYSDETRAQLCNKTTPKNDMKTASYYYDNDTNERVPGLEGEIARADVVRNFGVIKYYRSIEEGDYKTPDGTDKFRSTPAAEGTPWLGDRTGALPLESRVNVLESLEETDYVFTLEDTTFAGGNCKVWIDIPAMRIDPTEIISGDIVQVQVRLLFNRKPSGICPECDPPDVCDVMLDVAIICDVVAGREYCMFFPMVLQNETAGNWQTGIAISAKEDLPDDAWVRLELNDTISAVPAVYTKNFTGKGKVWSFVLDNILNEFDKSVQSGFASLRVISNYSMDGYQFLNAGGTFGAGSNARGCRVGECCPGVWK
ncbi:MAG: hypothetical protein DRI57_05550 [Deltaproteobacteria bacterium]|nr:MAG: hypothetical protein DRI57_05550 [Deltaproteobacteria bacterium]